VFIEPVEQGDAHAWLEMRGALWPDEDLQDLETGIADFFNGTSKYVAAAFMARDSAGVPVGFLELNLRPYAEGAAFSPVPHIEGWFVIASARHQGLGRALVKAAEEWAFARGYRELTSDGLLENRLGERAHLAAGFREVERLIAFHKALL